MAAEQFKIQLVLTNEEWDRYEKVLRRVKGRKGTLKNSDLNRVLLGLAPTDKYITDKDVADFQGRGGTSARARKGKPEGHLAEGENEKTANGE